MSFFVATFFIFSSLNPRSLGSRTLEWERATDTALRSLDFSSLLCLLSSLLLMPLVSTSTSMPSSPPSSLLVLFLPLSLPLSTIKDDSTPRLSRFFLTLDLSRTPLSCMSFLRPLTLLGCTAVFFLFSCFFCLRMAFFSLIAFTAASSSLSRSLSASCPIPAASFSAILASSSSSRAASFRSISGSIKSAIFFPSMISGMMSNL
mmetsp:Transcript_18434/g.38378  ORF Transcript_18434/g.38378 Transcript_18434/m.38378 type:complete len:204 (-) Transcript_18434:1379-1990(-)